jgi:hypothetical protein
VLKQLVPTDNVLECKRAEEEGGFLVVEVIDSKLTGQIPTARGEVLRCRWEQNQRACRPFRTYTAKSFQVVFLVVDHILGGSDALLSIELH